MRTGSGISLARGLSGHAGAVPALVDVSEQRADGVRQAEPVRQHARDLAEGGDVAHARSWGHAGARVRDCKARTGGARSGGATARASPAIISRREPNLAAVA